MVGVMWGLLYLSAYSLYYSRVQHYLIVLNKMLNIELYTTEIKGCEFKLDERGLTIGQLKIEDHHDQCCCEDVYRNPFLVL